MTAPPVGRVIARILIDQIRMSRSKRELTLSQMPYEREYSSPLPYYTIQSAPPLLPYQERGYDLARTYSRSKVFGLGLVSWAVRMRDGTIPPDGAFTNDAQSTISQPK
jgi:hypothetical protein